MPRTKKVTTEAAVAATAAGTEKTKTAAKKPAVKKAAAKKTTEKTAAKKPAAKKTVAKKAAEVKAEYVVEFQDRQLSFKDLDKKVAKQLKAEGAEGAKKVAVYVKPEENSAYIVADGEPKGSVSLYD